MNAGTGYKVADQLSATLPGEDTITPGTGEVLTTSFTAGDGLDAADETLVGVASSSTTSISGAGASFDITITGGAVTDVQLNAAGADYEAADEITIFASDLGATTGTDLVITVATVDEDTISAGPDVTITAAVSTIA
ncbi:hypothetical protein SynSYN20_01655 [Synechococcus sp. SYN20]|uniref:hypothetical protein n=1 Tax=Synechococcus sp. SYN20 TaxID=1050714 RepID=UPI001648ABC9|nr:hypothetical protein [Synechococcus sp. SYN20]QNJ25982.1 hypothetical protein SynSYN20_01655 [Synechococcus sp. SYN20]